MRKTALLLTLLGLWACDDAGEPATPVDAMVDPDPDADVAPDAMVDEGVIEADSTPPDAAPPVDMMRPDAAPECPECPGAQTCDEATGQCQEPAACAGDDDCFDGRHCLAGVCTDDCAEDAVCPGSRTCDEATGRCVEPDMCFADADCDAGRHCLDGACADNCDEASPCPGAQVCQPDGTCADAAVCEADADCVGDRICAGGACADPCRENADCPGTRTCDLDTGRCPEPAMCFVADDCDPGRNCVDGTCEGACRGDADCPGAQACDAGACVEPARCEADLDCRGDRLCLDGGCGDPCRENADCPGATQCDLETGRCSEPAGECQRDRDCAEDELCVEGECREIQCSVNSECPAACVDQLCAEIPTACGVDADCDRGTCAVAGVCAVAGACAADADCPDAAPLCHGGQCVTCASDADCLGSEFCRAGRCALFGACEADADCRGSRTCVEGQCAPAACDGDRFDFPGRPPALALRTHTGLVACDGDEDVYSVALPADAGLNVTARADDGEGDLRVWITPTGRDDVLAEVDGIYGVESTGVLPVPAARTVDVHVTGRHGDHVPYSLSLTQTGRLDCVPDEAEGPHGNDTRDTASPLGLTSTTVRLCPGDTDWLAFRAPGGVTLSAELRTDDPAAVALELRGPDDAVIANGAVVERSLIAEGVTGAAGTHALRLSLEAEQALAAQVQITATPTPAAAAAACDAPRPLALGDAVVLSDELLVNRFEGSCAMGIAAAERVYRLDLDAATTVTFGVEPDDRQTAVYLRRACLDADSEAHCAFGPALGPVALDAGAWFVFVETGGFTTQTLTVRAVP